MITSQILVGTSEVKSLPIAPLHTSDDVVDRSCTSSFNTDCQLPNDSNPTNAKSLNAAGATPTTFGSN